MDENPATLRGLTAKEQTLVVGSVNESLERGECIYRTRSADGFHAIHKETNTKVLLWMLRFPLKPSSETSARFVSRLERIKSLGALTPNILSFGVDNYGASFLVMQDSQTRPLLDDSRNIPTLIQHLVLLLKACVPLHEAGIALGDVADDTFGLDGAERVLLLGVLGSFESGARQTAMLPPPDTLNYLAPEQRSGGSPDISSDVYSLGVYAYRLLTGRYLLGEKSAAGSLENPVVSAPAPSLVNPSLPGWVDGVIGKCLETDPVNRYASASSILAVVEQAVATGVVSDGSNTWARRTASVAPETVQEIQKSRELVATKREVRKTPRRDQQVPVVPPGREDRSMHLFVSALAVVIGLFVAGFLFFYFEAGGKSNKDSLEAGNEKAISAYAYYAPDVLKSSIEIVGDNTAPIEKRLSELVSLSKRNDPVIQSVLVAVVKFSGNDRLEKVASEAIVEGILTSNRKKSAAVIERWFRRVEREGGELSDSPAFGYLIRACNTSRPIANRREALELALDSEAIVAIRLSAALAFDESRELFLPTLRTLLAKQYPKMDVEDRGLEALVLSHRALAILVRGEVGTAIEALSEKDLKWSLRRSVEHDKSFLDDLIVEIIRRRILSPSHEVFLKELVAIRAEPDTWTIQSALVRSALGENTAEDTQLFARWDSPRSETVLLAIVSSSKSPLVSVAAFDMLASKPLVSEPGASLIPWVKANLWEYRERVAKPIAMLSLAGSIDSKKRGDAFAQLLPFAKQGLFQTIVRSGVPDLIEEALARMGGDLGSETVISLLSHPDPNVRKAAVTLLKGRNELEILQAILRAYEKEEDEDVKEFYRKTQWVVRQREARRVGQGRSK
jgi:hypothetical protein